VEPFLLGWVYGDGSGFTNAPTIMASGIIEGSVTNSSIGSIAHGPAGGFDDVRGWWLAQLLQTGRGMPDSDGLRRFGRVTGQHALTRPAAHAQSRIHLKTFVAHGTQTLTISLSCDFVRSTTVWCGVPAGM
jgi:hypothetical protein